MSGRLGAAALTLGLALLGASSAAAEPSAVDRALTPVGLDRAAARFDEPAMTRAGGAELTLQAWRALHRDPWTAVEHADSAVVSRDVDGARIADLVALGAERLDARPQRVGRLPESPSLAAAIAAVERAAGSSLDGPRRRALEAAAAAVPASIARPAARLLDASATAYRWRERALRGVPGRAARQRLFERLLAMRNGQPIDGAVRRAIRAIDLDALVTGAAVLARALDRARAELEHAPGVPHLRFRWDTPLGRVEIRGDGNDVYAAGVPRLLTIDTGGDDVYESGGATRSADQPISLLVDVRGNDVYRATDAAPAFGAGVLGYGMLVDLAGDDSYAGTTASQGAGLFGVGILYDARGDDRHLARRLAQGAAWFGIGILSDQGGRDRYEGWNSVQGFGGPRGFGLLVDREGDDQYVANDRDIDEPSDQARDHNDSSAQGCGMGHRPVSPEDVSLAGGVGVLLDLAGADRYSAGVFAQGVGYWYGTGALLDRAGDDEYAGVWYVQGSAAHFAVGVLADEGGDDRYVATHNMAQGAGHDFALGMLVDRAGNDRYDAPTTSLGAGNANGIGVFWDREGDDRYATRGGATLGGANFEPGALRAKLLALGVFLDTGGGRDVYPDAIPRAGNDRSWRQPAPAGAAAGSPILGVGLDE